MKDEAVGNHFQAHFNGENSREKVVKIVQDLQQKEIKQMVIIFENLITTFKSERQTLSEGFFDIAAMSTGLSRPFLTIPPLSEFQLGSLYCKVKVLHGKVTIALVVKA